MKNISLPEDRLFTSAVAGMAAGLAQNIFGVATKALNMTDRTFTDFASSLAIYTEPKDVWGYILATLFHLALGAILGIIFGYLIKTTSSKYYYLKGLGYGFILWFLTLTAGTIFDVPKFKQVPIGASYTTLLGGIFFGWVLAYVLKIIEAKSNMV